MLLARILRPSTARRLAFWVLLGSATVLAASLGFVLKGAHESVLSRDSEAMAALTTAAANTLAARTSGLETSARVVAATIGRQLDNRAFIESLLQTIAEAHVELASVVAAFEPGVFPGSDGPYAPFYAHVGDGIVHRDLAADPGNYLETEWYRHAGACPKGCWGRPFHSHSRDQLLINFGVPIRDSTGQTVGVLNVDVPQQWLQDAVSQIQLGSASFGYVLSEDGTFLTSPNATSIATSIFDRARDSNTPELAVIARRMLAGESGTQSYVSPTLHVQVRTFFTRLPNSGWSLAIVIIEDHFFRNARKIFLDSALVGLAGLTALGLFIWLAVRRMLAPLGRLAASAEHVAHGELDFRLDPPQRLDEVGRLTQSFIGMRDELRTHIAELTEATAARERLQSELEIAQHIQESMLPRGHFAQGGDFAFELQALLRPAKTVGGDLYAYFTQGPERFCFLVGDVSDKGVPAALFMARTITVAKASAAGVRSPVELLRLVNIELCRDNDDCMFVTMLCGVLELASGRVTFASAGHDAPIRVGTGGVSPIQITTGGPLGLDPDTDFPCSETVLAPGEAVVLFTDGVTEAQDSCQAMFGEERLLQILGRRGDNAPDILVAAISTGVAEFSGSAPQADDLTVLALRWHGNVTARRLSLELGADLASVGAVLDQIESWLEKSAVDLAARTDVRVALEELLVNSVSYGLLSYDRDGSTENPLIQVALKLDNDLLEAHLADNGIAFDPFARAEPHVDTEMDNRESGGLGVFLVRNLADKYSYRRVDGRNLIDVRFSLPTRSAIPSDTSSDP